MAFTKTAEDFLLEDLAKEAGLLDSLSRFTTRAGKAATPNKATSMAQQYAQRAAKAQASGNTMEAKHFQSLADKFSNLPTPPKKMKTWVSDSVPVGQKGTAFDRAVGAAEGRAAHRPIFQGV